MTPASTSVFRADLIFIFLALIIGYSLPCRSAEPGAVYSSPSGSKYTNLEGDTFELAYGIDLPFSGSGTTTGYSDSHYEYCQGVAYPGPDVFYTFTTSHDSSWKISLDGSEFDISLMVYRHDDEQPDPYILQDCMVVFPPGTPQTFLVVEVEAGARYYVVIDAGGGQENGLYHLSFEEFELIDLSCSGIPENEPPLMDNYDDGFNGGCSSPHHNFPMTILTAEETGNLILCGRSGWFQQGSSTNRDTDWFVGTIGQTGTVDISFASEACSIIYNLGPLDCDSVGILDEATSVEGTLVHLSVAGVPGDQFWLWVGPFSLSPPTWFPENEYDYALTVSGLASGPTVVRASSYSEIKALFFK